MFSKILAEAVRTSLAGTQGINLKGKCSMDDPCDEVTCPICNPDDLPEDEFNDLKGCGKKKMDASMGGCKKKKKSMDDDPEDDWEDADEGEYDDDEEDDIEDDDDVDEPCDDDPEYDMKKKRCAKRSMRQMRANCLTNGNGVSYMLPSGAVDLEMGWKSLDQLQETVHNLSTLEEMLMASDLSNEMQVQAATIMFNTVMSPYGVTMADQEEKPENKPGLLQRTRAAISRLVAFIRGVLERLATEGHRILVRYASVNAKHLRIGRRVKEYIDSQTQWVEETIHVNQDMVLLTDPGSSDLQSVIWRSDRLNSESVNIAADYGYIKTVNDLVVSVCGVMQKAGKEPAATILSETSSILNKISDAIAEHYVAGNIAGGMRTSIDLGGSYRIELIPQKKSAYEKSELSMAPNLTEGLGSQGPKDIFRKGSKGKAVNKATATTMVTDAIMLLEQNEKLLTTADLNGKVASKAVDETLKILDGAGKLESITQEDAALIRRAVEVLPSYSRLCYDIRKLHVHHAKLQARGRIEVAARSARAAGRRPKQ